MTGISSFPRGRQPSESVGGGSKADGGRAKTQGSDGGNKKGASSSYKRKRAAAQAEPQQPDFLFGLPKKKVKKAPTVAVEKVDAHKGGDDEASKIAQVRL